MTSGSLPVAADATIDIGARLSAQTAGTRLQLWFDNPGPGFPPDKVNQVFDLFERGTSESPVPGVGVGFAVCRAIVEVHRGSITALNTADGARVLIELPIGDTPAEFRKTVDFELARWSKLIREAGIKAD